MSKSDDNTPIDNELKAYLAGEDGVSAAYRQAGAEEPPAGLDQLILAAARNAVQKDKPRATTNSRQRFSLAASFMVGVLVTSMYFNQESEFAETATTSAPQADRIIAESVERPAPSPAFAPAAPAVTAGNAQPEPLTQEVSQQAANPGEQAARTVAPAQLERQEVSQSKAEADTALAGNSSAAQTQSSTAVANSEVTENPGPVAEAGAGVTTDLTPPGPEAIGEDVAETATAGNSRAMQTQSNTAVANSEARENAGLTAETEVRVIAGLAPPGTAPAVANVAGGQLEEIQITGSRIRDDAEVELRYRQTREEWLVQILALREEALGDAQALEELNAQLVEEVELFLQTYPDFDLNAELQALEE